MVLAGGLLASALAMPVSAQSGIRSSPAASAGAAGDLRMAQDAAPFQRVADRFVAAAMAGDIAAVSGLLSRGLLARSGPDAVRDTMDRQVVPFFRRGERTGPSTTVTRTTDAGGQQGFAFYMWLESTGQPPRPFTLYVVDEGGRPRVANVVPDVFVQGRHL